MAGNLYTADDISKMIKGKSVTPSNKSAGSSYTVSDVRAMLKNTGNQSKSDAKYVPSLNKKVSLDDFLLRKDSTSDQIGTVPVLGEEKQEPKSNEQIIAEYNAIDSYNILERALDKDKAEKYKQKQQMAPAYYAAMDSQIDDFMKKNGLSLNDLYWIAATQQKPTIPGPMAKANINMRSKVESYLGLPGAPTEEELTEYYLRKNIEGGTQKAVEESKKNKVLGTAVAAAVKPLASVATPIEGAINYLSGNPLQNQKGGTALNKMVGDMRESASGDFEKTGKFLYGIGNSMLDMGIAAALTQGNGTGALLGLGAASDSLNEGIERGLNPNQIIGTAAAAGAAEGIAENVSFGGLKNIFGGAAKEIANGAAKEVRKSVVGQLVGQMVREAGEEMATEVANQLFDTAINKDMAKHEIRAAELMEQGLTRKEAQSQVQKEMLNQVLYSGLAGAVSGGIMGGGSMVAGKVMGNLNPLQYTGSKQDAITTPAEVNISPIDAPNTDPYAIPRVPALEPQNGAVEPSVETSEATTSPVLNPTPDNPNPTARMPQSNALDPLGQAWLSDVEKGSGPIKERGYNDTLINKTDAPQELKNEFINNPMMYAQLSNKDTARRATEILQNNPLDVAVNRFYDLLNRGEPEAVVLGYELSRTLTQEGKIEESTRLIQDMSRQLTRAGQFSQAAAITMTHGNPEAAKMLLMKETAALNVAGQKKFGKKWKDFELTEAEMQAFSNIVNGDRESIKQVYEQVYDRIKREYPTTKFEKLMEFRRISMLLNIRTNIRNIVSNAFMYPLRTTADRVTALGEGAYQLLHPNYKRTNAYGYKRSEVAKQLSSQAFEEVKQTLLGNNKYDDVKGAVKNRQIFRDGVGGKAIDTFTSGIISKVNEIIGTDFDSRGVLAKVNEGMGKQANQSLIETARNLTYWLLEKGDDVYVRKNFESRMASYIDAQGITDIESIPPDAYVLAAQEAMKATFKDDTNLANALSNIKKSLGPVGEIFLPFTKTPANLAMRGIDYSPFGLWRGVRELNSARNPTEVSRAMSTLAQGATGTAGILLGVALAQSGIIQGPLSDDKDEAAFQRQQGMLPYSLKIGFNYYTYDWAQPAAIPMIFGAVIANQLKEDGAVDPIDLMKRSGIAAADSWLSLSPLQSLSDIFGGSGSPAENTLNTLSEFPLSLIPAQLGAIARATDPVQRSTYVPGDPMRTLTNQAMSKIPGLSKKLPAVYDTWGNEVKRSDSVPEAVLAQLLNPGQIGRSNPIEADAEIQRLYNETGDKGLFPHKMERNIKMGGESFDLDNEQYSEIQKVAGETSRNLVSSFIQSNEYQRMDNVTRADVITSLYEFARGIAKEQVLGYDMANSKDKKAYSVYADKGNEGVAIFYAIKNLVDGTKNNDIVAAVERANLNDADKGYYLSKLIGDGNISKAGQGAYDQYGYSGLYQWYYLKALADYNGDGNVTSQENTMSITSSNMPFDQQQYYINLLLGK